MKKRSFYILLSITLSLSITSFSEENKQSHHHHQMSTEKHETKLSGDSIFHLGSEWTNRTGEKLKFVSMKGKIQVLAMVYSSCQYVCPRIVADIKKLESKLGKRSKEINFVLVSIDPDRDKPEKLQKYSKSKKITHPNWYFLSGSDDSVLELAAVLGVKYKKLPDGEFSHSNIISIIDGEGVVKYQQVGLNQDPENSLSHIKKLLK